MKRMIKRKRGATKVDQTKASQLSLKSPSEKIVARAGREREVVVAPARRNVLPLQSGVKIVARAEVVVVEERKIAAAAVQERGGKLHDHASAAGVEGERVDLEGARHLVEVAASVAAADAVAE